MGKLNGCKSSEVPAMQEVQTKKTKSTLDMLWLAVFLWATVRKAFCATSAPTKTIALALLLASTAFGQVKMLTPHKQAKVTTSPFELEWPEEADWFHNGQWQRHTSGAKFESSPGLQTIVVWTRELTDDGRQVPTVMRFYVVVVAELPKEGQTVDEWAGQLPADVPVEKQDAKPYRGVRITMFTLKDEKACKPCLEWWNDYRPAFAAKGAFVSKKSKVPPHLQRDKPREVPWFLIDWYGKQYVERGMLTEARLNATLADINRIVESERGE